MRTLEREVLELIGQNFLAIFWGVYLVRIVINLCQFQNDLVYQLLTHEFAQIHQSERDFLGVYFLQKWESNAVEKCVFYLSILPLLPDKY